MGSHLCRYITAAADAHPRNNNTTDTTITTTPSLHIYPHNHPPQPTPTCVVTAASLDVLAGASMAATPALPTEKDPGRSMAPTWRTAAGITGAAWGGGWYGRWYGWQWG